MLRNKKCIWEWAFCPSFCQLIGSIYFLLSHFICSKLLFFLRALHFRLASSLTLSRVCTFFFEKLFFPLTQFFFFFFFFTEFIRTSSPMHMFTLGILRNYFERFTELSISAWGRKDFSTFTLEFQKFHEFEKI